MAFLKWNIFLFNISLKSSISKPKIIWNINIKIVNNITKIKWKDFDLLCEIYVLLNHSFVSCRKWFFFNYSTLVQWKYKGNGTIYFTHLYLQVTVFVIRPWVLISAPTPIIDQDHEYYYSYHCVSASEWKLRKLTTNVDHLSEDLWS